LVNTLARLPGIVLLGEKLLGLTFREGLPQWHRKPFREPRSARAETDAAERPVVLLWVDTFSRYLDSDVVRAAVKVLEAAQYDVRFLTPPDGGRPLCCGRTFLNAGMFSQARVELTRLMDALAPVPGATVVGLEPSCLLTLRDELPALFPGHAALEIAGRTKLFEEFLVDEREAGRLSLELHPTSGARVSVHGHCHQKAFGVDDTVAEVLGWIPGLEVQAIESSCCGMAGSFGYEVEHRDASRGMGELRLAPAIRDAPSDWGVVADGTSCRAQIQRLTSTRALHVAEVLAKHV